MDCLHGPLPIPSFPSLSVLDCNPNNLFPSPPLVTHTAPPSPTPSTTMCSTSFSSFSPAEHCRPTPLNLFLMQILCCCRLLVPPTSVKRQIYFFTLGFLSCFLCCCSLCAVVQRVCYTEAGSKNSEPSGVTRSRPAVLQPCSFFLFNGLMPVEAEVCDSHKIHRKNYVFKGLPLQDHSLLSGSERALS